MERIDLFDKYISGDMTESETAEFNKRKSEDKDFSSDFLIYKEIVRGIFKDEKEREHDLDEAFNHLSKEDLRKIVGPKTVVGNPRLKAKIINMVSLAASIAAVIAIVFTFNVQRSAKNSVDDVMFDCYYNPYSRSVGKVEDLSEASRQQLQQILPTLVQEYDKATEEQDIAEQGINLAMVYLKLHDRKMAKEILNDVKNKCSGNVQVRKQCDKLLEKLQ